MYREVALVLAEGLDKAVEEYAKVAFSGVHRIPYGQHWLISIYCGTISNVAQARRLITERGVAINAVAMNDNSRTPDLANWPYSARFNHMGEPDTCHQLPKGELEDTTYQLLKRYLWPDGAGGNLAELRARCVSLRDEWDNQTEYGQLFTILQLFEAE